MLCAEAVLQLLTTTGPGPRMAKLAQQHSGLLGPALAATLHGMVVPLSRARYSPM